MEKKKKTESKKQSIEELKVDLSIFKDGDEKLKNSHFPNAFIIYQEIMNALKKKYGRNSKIFISYVLKKVDSLIELSKTYFQKQKYDSAKIILSKSKALIKEYFEPEFITRKVEILNQLSCALRRSTLNEKSNIKFAIEGLHQAIKLGQKYDLNLGNTYVNQSAVYSQFGDDRKAQQASKEAIVELGSIAMQSNSPEMVRLYLIAYFNCGLYESKLNNYEGSKRWLSKGKDLAEEFINFKKIEGIKDIYKVMASKLQEIKEGFLHENSTMSQNFINNNCSYMNENYIEGKRNSSQVYHIESKIRDSSTKNKNDSIISIKKNHGKDSVFSKNYEPMDFNQMNFSDNDTKINNSSTNLKTKESPSSNEMSRKRPASAMNRINVPKDRHNSSVIILANK